ncbi:MAG: hypothetical protein HY080_00345 [Gammaproteobacteria bacterium]|nr:hypothetical protein [Gammaproteobacteria bacterium]
MRKQIPYIIDIEASGFGQDSYPIEVGLALAPLQRYCALIQPIDEWKHWDERAAHIHGITRETLRCHGKPVQQVATELNALLQNHTVYSDGWVVDKPWIICLFAAARVKQNFFISPLENILNEQQITSWDSTKQGVVHELQLQRHRASYDALIIQETYRRTLNGS